MIDTLLKQTLDYNSDTGVFTWLVANSNCVSIGDVAGCRRGSGYMQISIDGSLYLSHRLAWLYVYGSFPDDQIDHINGVKDDNRIENLRDVTSSENGKNKKLQKNNKSGFVGVRFREDRCKWIARIQVDGKLNHLGQFVDRGDAIEARKEADIKYGFHENNGRK